MQQNSESPCQYEMIKFNDQSPKLGQNLDWESSCLNQLSELFGEVKKSQALTGHQIKQNKQSLKMKLNYKEQYDEEMNQNNGVFEKDQDQKIKYIQLSNQNQGEDNYQNSNANFDHLKTKKEKTFAQSSQLRNKLQNQIFQQTDTFSSQQKNTNFIKFIINHFLQYFPSSLASFSSDKQSELLAQFKFILKRLKSNKILNNRQSLKLIFIISPYAYQYRKFIFQLFSGDLFTRQKILDCNYIRPKNKKQYLLCKKVFMLRCRNKKLVDRVETR